jgi:hypothetical protein
MEAEEASLQMVMGQEEEIMGEDFLHAWPGGRVLLQYIPDEVNCFRRDVLWER